MTNRPSGLQLDRSERGMTERSDGAAIVAVRG
jgi:hypothetical protein